MDILVDGAHGVAAPSSLDLAFVSPSGSTEKYASLAYQWMTLRSSLARRPSAKKLQGTQCRRSPWWCFLVNFRCTSDWRRRNHRQEI